MVPSASVLTVSGCHIRGRADPLSRTGVPIAYPRMVALESMLEKKLNPMTVLAKLHVMPSGVNKFNA